MMKKLFFPLCLLLSLSPVLYANGDEKGLTLELLEQNREGVSQEEDEELRKRLVALYDQSILSYKEMQDVALEVTGIRNRAEQALERTRAIQAQLDQPYTEQTTPESEQPPTVEQLMTLVRNEEESLQQLEAEEKESLEKQSALLDAVSGSSQKIVEHRQKLQQIEKDLQTPATADESPRMSEARQLALMTRKRLRSALLQRYQLQIDHQQPLQNLLLAEQDLLKRQIKQRSSSVQQLSDQLHQLQEKLAEENKRRAEEEQVKAEGLPKPIRAIAEQSVVLTDEQRTVTESNTRLSERLQTSKQMLNQIQGELNETRRRVELMGSSEAIGRVLIKRKGELPSLESYRRDVVSRIKLIDKASSRVVDLDELRRDLTDPEQVVGQLMLSSEEEIATRVSGIAYFRSVIELEYRKKAQQLVNDQRDQLNTLSQLYGRYISQLTELDVAERQLVAEAEKFSRYIDERLIGIANLSPLTETRLTDLWMGVEWVFSPRDWKESIQLEVEHLQQQPLLLLPLLILALFLTRMKRIQQSLGQITGTSRGVRDDSILYAFAALLHTLLLAAPVPLLLLWFYWVIESNPLSNYYMLQLSVALPTLAVMLLTANFFQYASMRQGVGPRNLLWPEELSHQVNHELRWFKWIAALLLLLVAFAGANGGETALVGVGRPALIVLSIMVLVLALRLLNHPGSTLDRNFFTLPVALVALMVAGSSVMGYHHTALLLGEKFYLTVLFLLVVLLLKGLVFRFLQISDRRLRFEEAIKRRDELRLLRQQSDLTEEATDSIVPEAEPDTVDIRELGEQARRLVMSSIYLLTIIGLWLVWGELFPALTVLESVTLPLTTTDFVDGIEKLRPINLLDLGVGLVMLAITVVLAKNLPGLMEIILLQRLPLDTGSRYAIRTLTQYLIAAVGVISVFNIMGMQWSSIQWLVAALSVGLGFGLQEIVANFISGIILLFERPIRVGDTVTVGDVSGTVVRIRIRATTIRTWDQQELVVPNKEFITAKLLNWTLGDPINRLVIPVGVAYGSDVELAHQLMLEAAAEVDLVVTDPEPTVSFEEFGDSALILKIRCYLNSINHRILALTQMHHRINNKFNEAGISMAFPQRDIHFDSSQPINVRLSTESQERGS